MQKIIQQIRSELLPLINPDEGGGRQSGGYMPITIVGRDTMVKRIPSQNYKELSRLVPISWF